MMTPELCATLHGVAGAMASFPDGWWIIGSAAVTLHGIDAGPVDDVDLLIERGLANAVLDRLGIAPIVGVGMAFGGRVRGPLARRWP